MAEESPELIAAMRDLSRRFADRIPSVYEESEQLFLKIKTHTRAADCAEETQDLLRAVHSLVGTGRQFGFMELADVAAACEKQVAALKEASDEDWSAALELTADKLAALFAFHVEIPE